MAVRYHIRKLQRPDLEEVAALEASCFSRPWKYRDFEETLSNPDRFYLVAETDPVFPNVTAAILGGCMLTHIAGEGEITNLAVCEKYRNQHIATALLTRLIQLGEQKYGIAAYMLEVRSANMAARRLYERMGFVSLGIRPNFYDFPKDDALTMRYERTGD